MIKTLIGKLSRYLSPSAADRLSRQIGAERSHAEADLLIDQIPTAALQEKGAQRHSLESGCGSSGS